MHPTPRTTAGRRVHKLATVGPTVRVRIVALLLALAAMVACGSVRAAAGAAPATHSAAVAAAETLYADWLDAGAAVDAIDSGLMATVDGRDRAGWLEARNGARHELDARLSALHERSLGHDDARATRLMREALAEAAADPEAGQTATGAAPPLAPGGAHCDGAQHEDATATQLRAALYACFDEFGDDIPFEGRRIVRTTALALLAELDTAERRRALFAALTPLWIAVNADDSPTSPYRRLLRAEGAAARASRHSPVSAAAATLGTTSAQAERWLVALLEAWRQANPGPPLEPWDYWHHYATASRALDAHVPLEAIAALNQRFYADLGVDLARLQVLDDLAPRLNKAPLAYADHVRIGRYVDGLWRPAVLRVSANMAHGGLFVLNELVHEYGHAAHEAAIRTRPAFYSMGDTLFLEAFADVPSWSVAEPDWQRRYLGVTAGKTGAARELLSNVMLDVAWGLFELRMLRDADTDPNVLWSDIARRYLNVVPHPELSWWALRVQLVESPGYMANYGLGAILTAELRARINARIGRFDAGNPRWYGFVSQRLLAQGAAVDTPVLLRRFLGRPVTPAALIGQIRRLQRAGATSIPR